MYWATGILGFLLAVAPWLFGYSNNSAALWTSLLIGAAAIVISFIEGAQSDREAWEYWAAGILGVVAVAAPFVLGFGSYTAAMWTSVVAGILLVVFAGGKLTTGQFKST